MKTAFDNGINMFDVRDPILGTSIGPLTYRTPRPTLAESLSERWAE